MGEVKISLIGTEHMAASLSTSFKKLGNTIVPLKGCKVCWIAIDTPVNEKGQGNIKPVLDAIGDVKPQLKDGTLVIVSSQIPVGTSKMIVKILGKKFGYAYMPELMRIGLGPSDFMNQSVITIGVDDDKYKNVILKIFPGKKVYFTNVATGEMVKHATNAFLAASLCFIYDIADLCKAVGADVTDVAKALKSDYRIGQEAYLDASAGFSGGHLERDLDYLQKVAKSKKVKIPVLDAVMEKNLKRRQIVIKNLGNVKGKRIAFWGITYKPGAPPSESSLPAKLMRDLKRKGAKINIYDRLYTDTDPYESVKNCMAIVCITPWEDLLKVDYKKVSRQMKNPKIFFDARNFFKDTDMKGLTYIGVGR